MNKYAHDVIVPDAESNLNKKKQVAEMFNSIAGKYDFLNRFLSAGVDIWWRKKAISQLKKLKPKIVLDVATGTADVALMTHKELHPDKIYGIDISAGMLDLGRKKIQQKGLEKIIELQQGDSENIAFEDNFFDGITVAFGVRNFENLEKGLAEMLRVLKPRGKLVVLEFSKPKQKSFKFLYQFYLSKLAPGLVQAFASDKKAYQYLNNSVFAFPEGQNFLNIMHGVGFTQTYLQPLSLGICTIYCGTKV